eukprot:154527-Amphidinium_carterae.1
MACGPTATQRICGPERLHTCDTHWCSESSHPRQFQQTLTAYNLFPTPHKVPSTPVMQVNNHKYPVVRVLFLIAGLSSQQCTFKIEVLVD